MIPGANVPVSAVLAAWSGLDGQYKDAGWHLLFMIPFTKWLKAFGKGIKYLKPLLRNKKLAGALRRVAGNPNVEKALEYIKANKDSIRQAGEEIIKITEKEIKNKANKEKDARIKKQINEALSGMAGVEGLLEVLQHVKENVSKKDIAETTQEGTAPTKVDGNAESVLSNKNTYNLFRSSSLKK